MTTQADDQLWSAVADPSRRRVIDLLVSNGEVSANWLAGRVPFSRQAVSKHLGVLEEAGLVSRRKQGREVLFQVEAHRLDQATRVMAVSIGRSKSGRGLTDSRSSSSANTSFGVLNPSIARGRSLSEFAIA
ncbi:MAG: ArsR/SmtB family transcription factor [Streptosporangiaceae bacterium]